MKIISRSGGRSAVAASAYRSGEKLKFSVLSSVAYQSGEKIYNEDVTFDYRRKKGIVHKEIILPQNAPKEFHNRSILWNAVEASEKRKDAQLAREIIVALPKELSRNEQIALLRNYVIESFVSQGMCVDFAVHDKQNGNPHAHILLTTRNVSPNGFINKNREWNKKKQIESWRKNWAEICNKTLREKGFQIKIDHRTLKAQGIDRIPTIHYGNSSELKMRNQVIIEYNKQNNDIEIAKYINQLCWGYNLVLTEIQTIIKHNEFKLTQPQKDTLKALRGQRKKIEIEYQKQTLLLSLRQDRKEISKDLTSPPTELLNVSEENFNQILNELSDEQKRNILAEKEENEHQKNIYNDRTI